MRGYTEKERNCSKKNDIIPIDRHLKSKSDVRESGLLKSAKIKKENEL